MDRTPDLDRDTDSIELPPPKDAPGARGIDDHTSIEPDDFGHRPIDGLDTGVDTEHLGEPEGAPKV
jgi:hypothetical protein